LSKDNLIFFGEKLVRVSNNKYNGLFLIVNEKFALYNLIIIRLVNFVDKFG